MYTILSFCMIVVLLLATVTGKVFVRSKNGSQSVEFVDSAAEFGPNMPADGIMGYLFNVNPPNACQPVEPPPANSSFWIALIIRDNCTFVDKIKNVQQWSVAAIVYNHAGDNSTGPMSGDGSNIYIPSVFVGHMDGIELSQHYCFNCTVPDHGAYQILLKEPRYLFLFWPFGVVIGSCFILIILFILVKVIRDFTRKKKSRLSKKHLKKIPVKKFKKGDTYDVCAICLDEYEEGDKIRILPCSHVYHAKCVDPWLTQSKRSCPICKKRVIPKDETESNSDDSDDESLSVSERTPLLGSTSRTLPSSSLACEHSGVPAETGETRQDPVNNELNNCMHSVEPGSENGPVDENRATTMTEPAVAALVFVPKYASTTESNVSSKENTKVQSTILKMSANENAVNVGVEAENPGFVADEVSANDGEAFLCCANDIVFKDPGRKDDKKHSRVI